MKVKKLNIEAVEAVDIPQLFNQQDIAYHTISTVNWKEYPYCPDVKFRMAHTHDAILLHFKVTEEAVRAHGGRDNDPVYEDSCVEFFCIPGGDDFY